MFNRETENLPTFEDLPKEIWHEIFFYLGVGIILKLVRVSKKLTMAAHDQGFWRENFKRLPHPNSGNMTILHCVALFHQPAAQLAVLQYPSIWAALPNGATALHIAANNGDLETVSALLEINSNIINETCLYYGKYRDATALHIAVHNGNLDMVNALLARNANIKLTCYKYNSAYSADNLTALEMAEENGHAEIVLAINKQRLMNYIAKKNEQLQKNDYAFTSFASMFIFRDYRCVKQERNAAIALKNVVFDGADDSCLAAHLAVLHRSDKLKFIYNSYKVCQQQSMETNNQFPNFS